MEMVENKIASGCFITTGEELCEQLAFILKDTPDIYPICGISYEEVKLMPNRINVGIINTDKANGRGIHWVSFIHTGGFTTYYDSLGEPPTKEIAEKIAPNDVKLFWWAGQQQPDSSDKCGFYALMFIRNYIDRRMNMNSLFDYYMMGLDYNEDYDKNEQIIIDYLMSLG